ncbi:HlyD family efflux transporter periplasmic adaptor subunit [Rhodanobacter sp. A1T4]|uniref:HlyD family secretion protein n=1 Tax=Rhodanobacter sp. A1T4 TaxID=2723087 RepID=UPI00160CF946|nr:HlyD family efflux transporter periplasmic adaptor subunit [Rhodanobacter sp. A1T4]MBB6249443.1 membrane fusion protein [Rhodanobacter sp. A1T4]
MEGLFRNEVLQAQRGQWLGAINLATPLSFVWWAVLAVALAVVILLLLAFGEYSPRETVSGQLLPSAGLLTLSAQTTGTVTHTFVHEGERVAAGQLLAEVSSDLATNMGDTHALVGARLRMQEVQLRDTLANLQPQAIAQTKDLRSRIDMLQAQIAQFGGQLMLQRQQADAAADLFKKVQPLHQLGIISIVALNQYQATALSQQAEVKTLNRQRLDTEQQLSTLQAQLTQLPLDTTAKANQLRGQLAQLDAQLVENEAARATMLRASCAGLVSTLLVQPGQNVAAGQPLLSILPQDSKLEAQLLLTSDAIGFIEPGNRVMLRYRGYPYQKFGQQYGRVQQISRSALSNAESASLLGKSVAEPLYRVLVKLDRQTINAYGKVEALKPGMALDADVLLHHRSLWQWIFEPLSGMRQKLVVHE